MQIYTVNHFHLEKISILQKLENKPLQIQLSLKLAAKSEIS